MVRQRSWIDTLDIHCTIGYSMMDSIHCTLFFFQMVLVESEILFEPSDPRTCSPPSTIGNLNHHCFTKDFTLRNQVSHLFYGLESLGVWNISGLRAHGTRVPNVWWLDPHLCQTSRGAAIEPLKPMYYILAIYYIIYYIHSKWIWFIQTHQ